MSFPISWEANKDDLEDKSGLASYWVDGNNYKFRLETFGDALRIGAMLDCAFSMGKSFSADLFTDSVKRLLDENSVRMKSKD